MVAALRPNAHDQIEATPGTNEGILACAVAAQEQDDERALGGR